MTNPVASLFWSSDTPLREESIPEAIPYDIKWQCPTCKVVLNHSFDRDEIAYCINGHKSKRPDSARIVWSGQRTEG